MPLPADLPEVPSHDAGIASTPPGPRPLAASRLTLAEKVALLSGADMWHTRSLPQHRTRSATMSDGPHGLRRQPEGGDHLGATGSNPATCFPTAAALGCSWDPDLLAAVGAALGAEAAAEGVDVLLGPGLNIKRHPHCGRNFEYLSEDPLLSGRLAAAMVRGIQSTGVSACLKHFAVNNQEGHRLVVDAVVDERTLREIYLTGFEIAVKQSRPHAVMAAYNRVNGTYCCEHPGLLTQILRGEWGFPGLVVSDWGATNDRAAAVAAGMDLEMPASGNISDADVVAAVREGRLSQAAVDACAERVVALAERPRPGPPVVDYDAHHTLARRAAAQSSVLLTNNGLLPLRPAGGLAVIGAFAATPRYQGAGSSLVNPTRLDTLLDAVRGRDGVAVQYRPGYDPATAESDVALIAEAVSAARAADAAVVVVGLPGSRESEGFDRTDFGLPKQHDLLVDAVCSANPNTVVVLMSGSPVAVPWADRPAAVLACHLGGQAGGSAIADVLFGDEEPSGRLAESWPFTASDVPSDPWFPGDGRRADYREGVFVGYRYYATAGVPLRFPFGHGLSYTSVAYGELRLRPAGDGRPPPAGEPHSPAGPPAGDPRAAVPLAHFRAGDIAGDAALADVLVPVRNVGERTGAEVVQLYVHPLPPSTAGRLEGNTPGGTVSRPPLRPDQELCGFAKVRLAAGEDSEAVITLGTRAFAHFDSEAHTWTIAPGDYEIRVGSSSTDIAVRAAVRIEPVAAPDHTADDRLRLSLLRAPESGPPSVTAVRHDDLVAVSDEAFAALLGRPVPPPDPPRPFHRNSTLAHLRQTPSGRLLHAALMRVLREPLAAIAQGDPEVERRLLDAADEAPLRQVALFSNGAVTWQTLDAVIDWLNGNRVAAVRGLGPALRRQWLPAAIRRLPARRR